MTGFIVCVFPFRNRVSSTEAFEGLELGEGKLSRPVLRGPGGRKAAWLLGDRVAMSSYPNQYRPRVVSWDPPSSQSTQLNSSCGGPSHYVGIRSAFVLSGQRPA